MISVIVVRYVPPGIGPWVHIVSARYQTLSTTHYNRASDTAFCLLAVLRAPKLELRLEKFRRTAALPVGSRGTGTRQGLAFRSHEAARAVLVRYRVLVFRLLWFHREHLSTRGLTGTVQ